MEPTGHPDDHALIDGRALIINSIFPTVQGEGPHAGEPAIFVRLSGCNLRCHFCDTEFEKGSEMTVESVVSRVRELHADCETDLVVLTGGEPLRQQILPLIALLDDAGFLTQIETAGTVWTPPVIIDDRRLRLDHFISLGVVELVCSPKTPKVVPEVEEFCEHFKYIIRKGETDPDDGLPIMSTQIEGHTARLYRPDPGNVIPTRWVQPCFEYLHMGRETVADERRTLDNMTECVRIAMKHGYRVSLQQHKILGIE